ncbi:MAG TPA: hypothetical protein VHP83_14010, partial [Aggregatilineaceae bacterium]|nr:hypothetical protein [Aggregatilineaceae bacterium]
MKFNRGHWEILPGTEAIYPATIVDTVVEPDSIMITGYDHTIQARWNYIHGTSITARFSSPMPNVIRVQLTHFKGLREHLPAFDLQDAHPAVSTGRDEHHVWLKSGNLSVVAPVDGVWQFAFQRDDQPLTASEEHAIGLFTQQGKTYLRDQLSLQVGETVYGLGEHFGPLVKNGQALDSWNDDGGTDSELAYKNVPFYITSQG